jgi:hypothetical protein
MYKLNKAVSYRSPNTENKKSTTTQHSLIKLKDNRWLTASHLIEVVES